MSLQQQLLLFFAAALAGAVNSVAGGGTLLTFPALLSTGQLPIVANATSTIALWPGQLSSLWGYRKEIGENRRVILLLAVPSLTGGLLGAYLLLKTSNKTFAAVVPFLILAATLLFMAQEPISRWLRSRAKSAETPPPDSSGQSAAPTTPAASSSLPLMLTPHTLFVLVFQFLVAIYGGYFGAGIGILMLAALGFMGFTHIHQMNGLKNINGLLINAVAIATFIFRHTLPGEGVGPHQNQLVNWPLALLMAAGSIIGGYSGAGIARRIGQKNVRRVIIFIGFALTLSLLIHQPEPQKTPQATSPARR